MIGLILAHQVPANRVCGQDLSPWHHKLLRESSAVLIEALPVKSQSETPSL